MTRIISNIEALKEAVSAELPDYIIIGKRNTNPNEGAQIDPYSITVEKFLEIVDASSGTSLLIDEDDFISDSDTKAPTQQSTKAYIASQLAAGGFTLLDDDTMSAASRTQAATQGSIKVYIDTSVTFDNPVGETTVRNSFGDIKTGVTNIDGLTYQEIIELMFFPYALPSFTSFSLSGISTAQEIGSTITQNQTFTWGYNNSNNISTSATAIGLTELTGGGYLPVTPGYPKSTTSTAISFNSNITSNTPGDTVTFQITGLNTKSNTFSRNLTIGFYGRVFWGCSASTTLSSGTEAQILAALTNNQSSLTSSLGSNPTTIQGAQMTFNPSGQMYSYLLVPAGVQLPVDIRSNTLPNNANSFAMAEGRSGQVNITIAMNTGINVSYHVFRSLNTTGASSTAIIQS